MSYYSFYLKKCHEVLVQQLWPKIGLKWLNCQNKRNSEDCVFHDLHELSSPYKNFAREHLSIIFHGELDSPVPFHVRNI